MERPMCMRSEEDRLKTFLKWPKDAPVPAERIAKAGFFYKGDGLAVQCYSCGGIITDWGYADSAMGRHRRMNELCPFVLDPVNSENIPMQHSDIDVSITSTDKSRNNFFEANEKYNLEAERINSFNKLSKSIQWASILAEEGFYSLNEGDKIQCFYCSIIFRDWTLLSYKDHPLIQHRFKSPNCKKALNTLDNLIKKFNLNPQGSEILSLLGFEKMDNEYFSKFCTSAARLKSFETWPTDLKQKPNMLADAGFYYLFEGDKVRCFYCALLLSFWSPEDDPWIEHAKWNQGCKFLQLSKGLSFIKRVNTAQGAAISTHDTNNIQQNLDEKINLALKSSIVSTALSVGLEDEDIRNVIRARLMSGLSLHNTPDELINDTINYTSKSKLQKENDVIVCREKDKKEENLKEEIRELKELRLCKICLDEEVGIVFLPCGHLVTCVQCSNGMTQCPMCRGIINGAVRTFLS